MPFAGSMNPAGNVMTPIALLQTPGGSLTYAADGISVLETDDGTSTPILKPSIANLQIVMNNTQGPILGALVAGSLDVANADTGILTTAAPIANLHGIPANWGPGRGNWDASSIKRIYATILLQTIVPGAVTDVGSAQVNSIFLSGSDVLISFRNQGLSDIDAMTVQLEYRHSIEIG